MPEILANLPCREHAGRVWGYTVLGLGLRVYRVEGLWFQGLRLRVWGEGLGFGVSDSGFRLSFRIPKGSFLRKTHRNPD